MKKNFVKAFTLLLFAAVALSSCSVGYRERHGRGHNDRHDRDHHYRSY